MAKKITKVEGINSITRVDLKKKIGTKDAANLFLQKKISFLIERGFNIDSSASEEVKEWDHKAKKVWRS